MMALEDCSVLCDGVIDCGVLCDGVIDCGVFTGQPTYVQVIQSKISVEF